MKQFWKKACILVFAPALVFLVQASIAAQSVELVTFSRATTGQMNVGELVFPSETQMADFGVDQLPGAIFSVFTLEGADGASLLFTGSFDVPIREVSIGEILDPQSFTGSQNINIYATIDAGEDFNLGFSNGVNVGYFNVALDSGVDGDLRITSGLIDTGGGLLTVAAVPEPSALGAFVLAGLLVGIRRNRFR